MLINVRCVGCAKVLADKWQYYERECKKLEEGVGVVGGAAAKKPKGGDDDKAGPAPRTRGQILDDMGLTRICCRRHMLGCVDLMELI